MPEWYLVEIDTIADDDGTEFRWMIPFNSLDELMTYKLKHFKAKYAIKYIPDELPIL